MQLSMLFAIFILFLRCDIFFQTLRGCTNAGNHHPMEKMLTRQTRRRRHSVQDLPTLPLLERTAQPFVRTNLASLRFEFASPDFAFVEILVIDPLPNYVFLELTVMRMQLECSPDFFEPHLCLRPPDFVLVLASTGFRTCVSNIRRISTLVPILLAITWNLSNFVKTSRESWFCLGSASSKIYSRIN